MKILIYVFVILLLLFFWGCSSLRTEFVNLHKYSDKDYITKEFEVYRVNECLYPILDSIIMKTEICPIYQGLKDRIGFYFNIYKRYIPGTTEFSPYPNLLVNVIYAPKFENHAKWTDAVFNYKGYDFYFFGIFISDFLEKTNEFVTIRCIDPDKYQMDYLAREYEDMYWGYEYRNDSIINTVYGLCGGR